MITTDQVGMFDAKNHLSEIVERVQKTGLPITITNRGTPVVDIVPTQKNDDSQMTKQEAFDAVSRLWETMPPAKPGEIRELIEEGRI